MNALRILIEFVVYITHVHISNILLFSFLLLLIPCVCVCELLINYYCCSYYQACLDTGRPVKKSDFFGIWLKVKDGHFCPQFSKAIKTMKKGEKAIFTVRRQYGFGEDGKRDYTFSRGYYVSVPPNATL